MSGSSGAHGVVGEAGGPGRASGPLSSVVESVPDESGSIAVRLSKDTLVKAEDRLRFRHQWDIRGSTLQVTQEMVGMGCRREELVLCPRRPPDPLLLSATVACCPLSLPAQSPLPVFFPHSALSS